jgi:hypothetical protein
MVFRSVELTVTKKEQTTEYRLDNHLAAPLEQQKEYSLEKT